MPKNAWFSCVLSLLLYNTPPKPQISLFWFWLVHNGAFTANMKCFFFFFFCDGCLYTQACMHWSSITCGWLFFFILCDNRQLRQLYNNEIWLQLIICWSPASCKVSVQGPSTKCNMEKWLQIHSTPRYCGFFCLFVCLRLFLLLNFAHCRLFLALAW